MSEYLVQNGNTLSMQFESSQKPRIYANALFIVLEGIGEDLFNIPTDADWDQCVVDYTEYTITVNQPAEGGTISANPTTATYGTTITLTATPDEGKMLDQWTVTDADNNPVSVSKAGTFVMPQSDVTVTATFKDYVELQPATFSGSYTDAVSGAEFTYSITRNADQTLTFNISWNIALEGANPQITVGAKQFQGMTINGNSATYTTEDTFEDGETPTIFFYVAYTGNAARIDVSYTVGESNGETQPSAIENTYNETRTHKVIENGQLYIIKNGVRYNALGAEIR